MHLRQCTYMMTTAHQGAEQLAGRPAADASTFWQDVPGLACREGGLRMTIFQAEAVDAISRDAAECCCNGTRVTRGSLVA